MPCNCENIDCLEVYLDPCASVINLPLVADSSGTWKMIYEFNGMNYRTDINVIIGQGIQIPNNFNEDYRHLLRFYKADGSLFNDTCYTFKAMPTIFTNPSDTPQVNGIKSLVFKIGDPDIVNLEGGYTASFANGSSLFSHPELANGIDVQVRVGNIDSEPIASGHQYFSVDPEDVNNGLIQMATPLFDINLYVIITPKSN